MGDRVKWPDVLARAAEIVKGYDTRVTLRQLFYRLVSEKLLKNTQPAYSTLSRETAKARREGWFPELIDRTRTIHRYQAFEGPDDAIEWLARIYRRDRTEGQEVSIYLGVEKETMVAQLEAWFGDLGFPIVALKGYSSQSYVDEIAQEVNGDGRPAVLIYAGDLDPSGEDIDRDFLARTGCFETDRRIAVNMDQITTYNLPPAMGKATDSRAPGFQEKYGVLVQVELEALPPDVVQVLYQDAINEFWDKSTFDEAIALEEADRGKL